MQFGIIVLSLISLSLRSIQLNMWKTSGITILQYRTPLLILLLLVTAFMGWHASKVKLSYDFARAIPTDHPKFIAYQQFKAKFGEDGNLLVIGV